jgi:hypothetical protein
LSQALFNASVDLNPHQIEAAVFALHSPLSKGVLLADEAPSSRRPITPPSKTVVGYAKIGPITMCIS